jgi:S1-C subfamily serine protease
MWGTYEIAAGEQPGFAQDCSGFAQDTLLGALWHGVPTPEAETRVVSLKATVPRLSLQGTALATYEKQREARTATTIEALFGVFDGGQREIVETTFEQESRAVMLHPHVLATVAHATVPDVVEVSVGQNVSVHTVPLQVTSMTVLARAVPTDQGVPVRVVHLNEPYDLALLQVDKKGLLQPVPYPATLSYGLGDPAHPTGGLQAGDCVAAVVTSREGGVHDTGADRLVVGKVLAKVPVAINSLTQTKLNVNMVTTDLMVQPGDSGSPVLALRAGKPVLIGLVSSTMYPTATFTYVSRIDPLLALADALQLVASRKSDQTLTQRDSQADFRGR